MCFISFRNCELQMSFRFSVLSCLSLSFSFFFYSKYLGGCSFIMGNPIRNFMKNLEMRQLNLNEWISKECLADSIILRTLLLCFITEAIQKAGTLAGRTPRLWSSPQDENI